jgi:RNA polymerase sigma factor (sigma-70 family)
MYEQDRQDDRDRRVREQAAKLYGEQRGFLTAIARLNSRSKVEAEEAVQEAFVSFVRHFDPGRGAPPIAWLILTLKRQCWRQERNAHHDRWVRGGWEEDCEEPRWLLETVHSQASDPERRVVEIDEGRRRLRALKPDQRDALGLQAAGFSYEEIAAEKGWSFSKASRSLRKGRAALRESTPAA